MNDLELMIGFSEMEYDVEVTLKSQGHTAQQLEDLQDRLTAEGVIRGPVVLGWEDAIGVFGQVDADEFETAHHVEWTAKMALLDAVDQSDQRDPEMADWVTISVQPHGWPFPLQQVPA